MLVLCALRDHHQASGDQQQAERIDDLFLINKWKSDSARLRLLPTTADRPAYSACIDGKPTAGGGGNVGDTYRFFRSKIESFDSPDDETDLARLERAICDLLSIVEITADTDDNVYVQRRDSTGCLQSRWHSFPTDRVSLTRCIGC